MNFGPADSPMLSQSEANELNQNGGTILCLNVPPKTNFGIDYMAWQVGEKFKGVKMIPPGVHFIHTSPASDYGSDFSPRIGFFVFLNSGDVLIRGWNEKQECLGVIQDEDENTRFKIGVKNHDFDANLGAYPFNTYKKWESLSSHITNKVIQRLEPVGKLIFSTAVKVDAEQDEKKTVPEMPKTFYTKIPTVKIEPHMSLAEVTRLSFDKSHILEKLIKSYDDDLTLLFGELEFSFISFMIGQSLEAFEQWKGLVVLLCSCEESMESNYDIYSQFVDILHCQLSEAPELFVTDSSDTASSNFLKFSLKSLFDIAAESTIPETLHQKLNDLKCFIGQKFDWTFGSDDLGEDSPVVVRL